MVKILHKFTREIIVKPIAHKSEMLQITTKERQAAAIEESQEQLELAEDLLKQMELEVISMDLSSKPTFQQRLKKYKENLETARTNVSKMEYQYKLQMNKETAMGGYFNPEDK